MHVNLYSHTHTPLDISAGMYNPDLLYDAQLVLVYRTFRNYINMTDLRNIQCAALDRF